MSRRLLPALALTVLAVAGQVQAAGIDHNDGDFTLGVGGGERMRVQTTGNVAIGTTAAPQKFTLGGGGHMLMDNGAVIYAKDSGGTARAAIYPRWTNNTMYIDGGTGGLILRTNNSATNAILIDASGNLNFGSGTATFGGTVSASSLITSAGITAGNSIQSDGASASFNFQDRTNTGRRSAWFRDSNISRLWDNTNGSLFSVDMNNGDIWNGGRMGISGGVVAGYALNVTGNVRINGGGGVCTMNGGAGATACGSDIRLKDHIKPLDDPFPKLALIKPVKFHWQDPKRSGQEHIGVIAQDVEKAYPQIVSEIYFDEKFPSAKAVDYGALVVPLIEAVNRLKADNDNLRRDFEAHKAAHP